MGRGLLLILGLFLALGIAEGILRVREHAAPELAAPPSAPAGATVLRSVRDLVRPHVDGYYQGIPYRTNRLGLRGPEIADSPAPGVVRIGLIGDSFTAGVGVPVEYIYATRLQQMLDAGDPGRYEVFNLGVPGASLRASVIRFERIGMALQPRVVVYGFTVNDIEGPHYRKTRRDAAEGTEPWYERCMVRAPLRVARLGCSGWNAVRNLLFPARDSYLGELRFNYLENQAAWSDFVAELERLRLLTERSGACRVLLVHEQLQGRKWPRPQRAIFDRVVDAAESLGFAVSDSRKAFRDVPFERVRLSALDPHPNAMGHEILAETLHDGIASLPGRCHEALPGS